jgi:hypothetical protein
MSVGFPFGTKYAIPIISSFVRQTKHLDFESESEYEFVSVKNEFNLFQLSSVKTCLNAL